MSCGELHFVFDAENGHVAAEDFVLRLPQGIQDKTTLFSHCSKAGQFPVYFGNNWDALNDCLRDFSWINQRRILIVHSDLLLASNEKELLTYLGILDTAVKFWEQREGHKLVVIFPREAKATVAGLLNKRKDV
jgi:hypothetical protein